MTSRISVLVLTTVFMTGSALAAGASSYESTPQKQTITIPTPKLPQRPTMPTPTMSAASMAPSQSGQAGTAVASQPEKKSLFSRFTGAVKSGAQKASTTVQQQFQSKCPPGFVPKTPEEAIACQSNFRRATGAVNKYAMPSKPVNPNETPEQRAARIAAENPVQQAVRQARGQAIAAGSQVVAAGTDAFARKTQQVSDKMTSAVTNKLDKIAPLPQAPVESLIPEDVMMPEDLGEQFMDQETIAQENETQLSPEANTGDQISEIERVKAGLKSVSGVSSDIQQEDPVEVEDPAPKRVLQQGYQKALGQAASSGAQVASAMGDAFARKADRFVSKLNRTGRPNVKQPVQGKVNPVEQVQEPSFAEGLAQPVDASDESQVVSPSVPEEAGKVELIQDIKERLAVLQSQLSDLQKQLEKSGE